MKVKKLNEGTWAIPKTEEKRKEGKVFMGRIKSLKDDIYPVFGDDILFDGLDAAESRLKELIEIPQDQIKESKEDLPILDDEEMYLFNLRMKDIRKIIVLIFDGLGYDMDDLALLKTITISGQEVPDSHRGKGGKYILVSSTTIQFEIKIWENGFIALENGLDVKLKFDNPLKVYDILLKRMK